jgi:uncharacterized protein
MRVSFRRSRPVMSVRRKLIPLFAVIAAAFIILLLLSFNMQRVAAQKGVKKRSVEPNDINIVTLGTPITENFNTLPASGSATFVNNTTLPGWYSARTGTGTTIVANDGSSNAGNLYSYGTGTNTDRALGSLGSGNAAVGNLFWGIILKNTSGSTVTSLAVSYTGEQWRNSAAAAQTVAFSYITGTTLTGSLADFQAAGTAVTQLDFTSPITGGTAGALDGNAAANRTALSFTINGLNLADQQQILLRWSDPDHTGSDHGLSIDDFSVTPNGGVVQPTLNIGDVSQAEGDSGTTTFSFPVSLTTPAGASGVSFTVNTADGTTNPATAGSDYVAIVGGSGSISQGNSSTTVSVTVNGDTTSEPNETFFVNISNVTGANAGDTQGLGTIVNDDVTLTSICQIQGSGTMSPVVGQSVTTRGIVTGSKAGSSGGYYIQDDACDADPNTSNGVFVFTGSTLPAAAVIGNQVQVGGTIQEFIPAADTNQKPLTEFTSGSTATVLSTGNSLPAPVVISAADTLAPGLENLERFEGMRVQVNSLTVVAPTQGTITEPSATVASNGVFYGVVTGVARPFREPGVNASDPLPAGAPANVPRFDENPERLRVDSDGQPGTTALDLNAGTVVTNLVGEMDYAFRTWTILPELASPPTVGTQTSSTPVPLANADELTVASFNMERFFDTVNDPNTSDPVLTQAAFDKRLGKASQIIRNVQRLPDVIGVEEMENLSTLQAVAAKVNTDQQAATGVNPNYVAYLVEGNDIGGIDVGFLVKESRITTNSVTQIELAGCDHVTATTCNNYINPNTGQPELLNDRPPLVLLASVPRPTGGTFAFTVIVNHLRSLSGVDDDTTPNGSGTEGNRIRNKRRAQAEFLANLIQSRQTANPNERIITIGDMNAFNINDGYVDVIGTVKGTPAPADQVVLASSDLVNPNQTNLIDTLPADQRYSYSFDGNAQVLDQIIVNPSALAQFNRIAYARDDADFAVKNYELANELRISDHDQPVAYFALGAPLTISEFRFRGPTFSPGQGIDGSLDEYVELYNNSAAPLTVNATDGSAGWALAFTNGAGTSTTVAAVIPNNTIIPAHGHYLLTNETGGVTIKQSVWKPNGITPTGGYTLTNYTPTDQTYGDASGGGRNDIPDNGAVAIFTTGNAANFSTTTLLDAVSLNTATGATANLFREGTALPSPGANDGQYAYVRKMTTGIPQDTGNNAADFTFVSTNGGSYGGVQSQLGAPGPEGTVSPIQRNAQIKSALIEPQAASTAAPNRVRNLTSVTNGAQGTLSIRRRFINTMGVPVTRLRFRVVDITTLNSPGYTPGGAQSDIRAIDGANFSVTTSRGMLTVLGTTIEQPAPLTQPNGGGLNSSLTVAIPGGQLMPGAPIDLHFLLGVQQGGSFRFFINVEALP